MKLKDLAKPQPPLCPHCNIPMEIHATMSGDQWICDNYHMCGGRRKLNKECLR